MERYQYERLKQPEDSLGEIRLARIRHGTPQDPIRVAIQTFALADVSNQQTYVWKALSYTWGEVEDTEDIWIEVSNRTEGGADAGPELKYLSVTRNLTEALRQIRRPDRDLMMWIDAICIDESTDTAALKERAWQVERMHQIYSRATAAIIWLGSEENDSTYALQLLDDLGSLIHVDWTTFAISTASGEYSEPMKQWASHERGPASREHQAVWALLGRSWFSRTWTRQEALLADEVRSVIQCGPKEVRFENFRRAIHCLSVLGFQQEFTDTEGNKDERLARALSICQRTYVDEANLMYRVRFCDCRDARDKVYGNLGIMSVLGDARFASSIKVDYVPAHTVFKVYLDFFKRHHERYGTLRLLNEAGLRQKSELRPTWVPDWRHMFTALDLSMESATSHFAFAECVFLEDDVLHVYGCSATQVVETYTLESKDAYSCGPQWYRELAGLIRKLMSNQSQETVCEQFNYALCCALNNRRIDLDIAQKYRTAVAGYVEYLLAQTSEPEKPVRDPREMIGESATWALEHCIAFFKQAPLPFMSCGDDFIGIGPQGAQKGDVVAAILGCRALLLLRPVSEDKFQVVGPCFVHGLNWGEALLGPLPEGHIVVPRLDLSRGAYVPYYLDTRTGDGSTWDPRIAWEELRPHPPMVNFLLMPTAAGEPLRCRPDSEYLKRHGVALRNFLLV